MPAEASFIDLKADVTLNPREDRTCPHTAQIGVVKPGTRGCAECLSEGTEWVKLRICMTCGHVGCCDSSVGKHANAHFKETGHPIIRSIEPGETWGWCYIDKAYL